MSISTSDSDKAELLLAGPRGRRFLLEFALASELARNPVRSEGSFGYAATLAARNLASGHNGTGAWFGWNAVVPQQSEGSLAEVAQRLEALELPEPTPVLIRKALVTATSTAQYWQAPEAEDALAAIPKMYAGLRCIADHVVDSTVTAWWWTPVAVSEQQSVHWEGTRTRGAAHLPREALLANRNHQRAAEQAALQERAAHPDVKWSGEWWSRPPDTVPSSTRLLNDGTPAGLWFVEDPLGWEHAESVELVAPESASVFEISSAADWAELCARFPLEVTAQKWNDWGRSTSGSARWVIPDWSQVASCYDAVHLQVGAYLACAGRAIRLDESSESSSVIAGWNPDETYWLSPVLASDDQSRQWTLEDDGAEMVWKLTPPSSAQQGDNCPPT